MATKSSRFSSAKIPIFGTEQQLDHHRII